MCSATPDFEDFGEFIRILNHPNWKGEYITTQPLHN